MILDYITEKIKKPFLKTPLDKVDTQVPYHKIEKDLSDEYDNFQFQTFFDSINNGYINIYQRTSEQAQKIDVYRQIARIAQCYAGINEIVDEIAYSRDFNIPLKIDIDLKNKKLEKEIIESFNKILKLIGAERNLYSFIRQSYIDGQMNVFIKYDENKKGIKNIYYLDPRFLYFDLKTQTYKYNDYLSSTINSNNYISNYFLYNTIRTNVNHSDIQEFEFSIEELVHQNFGIIADNGVILSELESAIKPANQLKTLEDLLIPLRFSRSVSRRVFNIDLSELPNSKAEAYMRELTNKFKYKKQYNTETGEVMNNQHITTMVEDYWIGNKAGAKGMTVDVLDETGNLGELGDILYFYKLLYRSMGIPTNRIYLDESSQQPLFDLQADAITNEDIRFFQKITRIRQIYTDFFMKLLKRELIATNKCNEIQFDNELKEHINIYFAEENQFIDRMNITVFMKKVEAFQVAKEFGGTVLPVDTLYKEIFKYSDNEIKEILTAIQKESKNKLYKTFYQSEEYDNSDQDSNDTENSKNNEPDANQDSEEFQD